MSDKEKIVVKLNNEKIELDSQKTVSPYDWYKEQAASLDEQDSELDELERRTPVYTTSTPKKKKHRYIKSILLTTSIAIIVGIGFGFGVLKMFVELDKTDTTVSSDQSIPVDGEEKTGNNISNSKKQSVTLNSISAFIVQAGMFSTEDKANEWKEKMKQAGFNVFSWKADDGIRLFTSVHLTQEKADQMAEKLAKSNYEGYVRQWSTEEKAIDLTVEEGKWLQGFAPLFLSMIENDTGEKALEGKIAEWNAWVKAAPKEISDALVTLKQSASSFSKAIKDDASQRSYYDQLIKTWYQYDQL
ncbi:SPOR domain-containing protein [Paraliobacillus sp. JSM ZJ581]|uniref:SPOR domain-containing protein n=1 Tax=Paraliobacillus sp. JSM ZJ581 TaxID=3342118 RepID=UPI0035A96DF7